MRISKLLSSSATLLPVLGSITTTEYLYTPKYSGFAVDTYRASDFQCKTVSDWNNDYTNIQALVGSQYKSLRVYISGGECCTLERIAAAASRTAGRTVLAGIQIDADGQFDKLNGDITAFFNTLTVMATYPGQKFNWLAGVSVGNKDISNGITDQLTIAKAVNYTRETLRLIKDSKGNCFDKLLNLPVGHVDTWQMWNTDSRDLIEAVDFIGASAFPFYQSDYALYGDNDVDNGWRLFRDALGSVDWAASSVTHPPEVWVTETGWPSEIPLGFSSGNATATVDGDAVARYWSDVNCHVLNYLPVTNFWWYTWQDYNAVYGTPSNPAPAPSFGIYTEENQLLLAESGAPIDWNC